MIDAFELWCWRRMLRVTWIDRKTNVWVIYNIKPEWTLESRIVKASLFYFGNVIRAGGMEYEVMVGRMGGYRSRGRPRQRWLDSIKKNFHGTIYNMIRALRCRRSWRASIIDVARGRIRLDGTVYSVLTLSKQRSRRYPAIKITDADYADDLVIFADSSRNAEKLLNVLE